MSRTGEFRLDRPLDLGESKSRGSVRCHLSAEEAFSALEDLVLSARREIWASLRDFDLFTPLRSTRARQIGTDWFDLVAHVLARGVRLRLILPDDGCICSPETHRSSWRARRALMAAAEVAGPRADVRVTIAPHGGRAGPLWRLLMWPVSLRNLMRTAARLNTLTPPECAARLRDMPGLGPFLRRAKDGGLRPVRTPPPPFSTPPTASA